MRNNTKQESFEIIMVVDFGDTYIVFMKRTSCMAYNGHRLGDVAVFENREPVTDVKFINKNS